MTLNGRYALLQKDTFYGAHKKNMNKDRPILSAAKCGPMILVSNNIRYMRIFTGVPREGASNDRWDRCSLQTKTNKKAVLWQGNRTKVVVVKLGLDTYS